MALIELNGLTLALSEGLSPTAAPPTGLAAWREGGLAPSDAFATALEDTGATVTPLPILRRVGDGSDATLTAPSGAAPVALLEEQEGVLGWRLFPESRRLSIAVRGAQWRGWVVELEPPTEEASLRARVRELEGTPALRHIACPGSFLDDSLHTQWPVLESSERLAGLPSDRPPRVLLWVHGVGSSTLGCFGDLARTQPGRRLVQAMLDRYDAVLGYDHPTLSVRPDANAQQLSVLLQEHLGAHPELQLDLLSTSRGALVVRSLVEREVARPAAQSLSVGRVLMVAPMSGGTLLADPTAWGRWLDHFTNLVRAAADGGQRRFSAATGAFAITTHRLRSLLNLLQALAWGARDPRHLPGLAALRPGSRYLRRLNESPLPEGLPEVESYAWVRSDFERGAVSLARPASVPRLLRHLDDTVDRLFAQRRNDLVVDHEHSLRGHPQLAARWRAAHAFPSNSDVHHLNFWTFRQTLRAAVRVLELRVPPSEDRRGPQDELEKRLLRERTEAVTETDTPERGELFRRELAALASVQPDPMASGQSAALSDPYKEGVQLKGVSYGAMVDGHHDRLAADSLVEPSRRERVLEAFFGARTCPLDVAEAEDSSDKPTLVLLPGLPGSHLARAGDRSPRVWLGLGQLLRGNLAEKASLARNGVDPANDAWELVPDGVLDLAYGRAIRSWREAGHSVCLAPFDWRKPLTRAADELDTLLERLSAEGHRSIVLVCHSTGGVVASLWAARHRRNLHRVRRAVFVGVPLAGTYQALELLTGASGLLGLISAFSLRDPHWEITRMAASWHGPVDLLPDPRVFDGPSCLAAESWDRGRPPTRDALAHGLAVLDELADSPLLSRTHALVGTNRSTVIRALRDPLRPDMRRDQMGPGDDTIPLKSALHPSLQSVHVANEGGHAFLLKKCSVIRAVRELAIHGTSMTLPAEEPEDIRQRAETAPRIPRAIHDMERLAMRMLIGAANADEIIAGIFGIAKARD